MESKWYKYADRIINLSVFDEFKMSKFRLMGEEYHEIICCVKGQTQNCFRYFSREEAEQELEKIYSILSK